MGKFISIPVDGGVTTKAVITATVTNGVITAISTDTPGAGYTFVPVVTVTSTDGKGSGATINVTSLVSNVPTFSLGSGGSGYTSSSTIVITVSAPPLMINADSVMAIMPVATGSSTASNNTLVIKLNTASAPTLTLTLANALNASTFVGDGAWAARSAIINAIMSATNVKIIDQLTQVQLPSNVLINQYAFA